MAELLREQDELVEEGRRLDREAEAQRIMGEVRRVQDAGGAVLVQHANGHAVDMAGGMEEVVRRALGAGMRVAMEPVGGRGQP